MMIQYVPLHVHSDGSSDGLGPVHKMVERAKQLKMPALALTDHGTLCNAIAFWSACTEAEIKPILGLEAYLIYSGKRHHITLLSLNETGFNNLIWMSSHAHQHGYMSGYPTITMDNLYTWRDGLFAMTGCAASAIHDGSFEDGMLYTSNLIDTLGIDNVAAELMFVGTHNIWSRPLEIAKRLNLQTVITNDSHYPCRDQCDAHRVVTQARKGYTYSAEHLWLKNIDEIYHEALKWADEEIVDTALFQTMTIASRVESWNMRSKPTLPKIEGIREQLIEDLKEALKRNVEQKGQKRIRMERLQTEFRVLSDKGFLDYVYILRDIVLWAKQQGIYVGPARGSGGGSYMLYLLGITEVDPIDYNLLFERFINPARSDYPDVDMDFESDRRHEVINYANQRWGGVPIATYATYSHKSVIHDIARVLKIPKPIEDAAADGAEDSEAFETFLSSHETARSAYESMLGQIRHRGKHAGGVIITSRPVPLERAGDDIVAAWTEGNHRELSQVGIVKYDLLGLTALSQLKLLVTLTSEPVPTKFDDQNVLDIFRDGDVSGIFQWTGSDGIRQLTMKIAPRTFEDLVAINSLYRPGALDAGTAEKYPTYMKSPRLIDPRIDKHLESTYGVICFQEQVMAVFAEVTGQSFSEADLARRVIVKSKTGDPAWEAEVEKLRSHFFSAGAANHFERPLLEKIWSELFTHSRYSFNRAHSVAYAMIAYQMAYYKRYHRAAFTTAMLQYDSTNAQTYLIDAIRGGLSVSMPHVNVSGESYTLHENIIYIPLTDISFLGEKAAKLIIREREANGPFLSYEDFDRRIPKRECNSRTRGFLERIGAFQGLSGDPRKAIPKYDELPIKGPFETQLDALGYVVPTRKLLQQIDRLQRTSGKKGEVAFAGFITETDDKVSKHGPYRVFYLSPHGSFWVRGEMADKIKVGDFVSGTKSQYGSSRNVKVHHIDSEDWA